MYSKEYILDRVNSIIKNRFEICAPEIGSNYDKENLLEKKYGLSARELLYLFFEIEKEFEISIPQESIIRGNFMTIQGIVAAVFDVLNKENIA